MPEEIKVVGADVAITDLVPLHERTVNFSDGKSGYRKILASLQEIGLIEPLCVYKENGHYRILDGFIRYKALQELGVERVPCMVYANKEAYTFNRMVNRLSHTQESRMLRKSLETLDEATIAKALGMKTIVHKINTTILRRLHPEVIKVLDKELISQGCAIEFTYVLPERQLQILEEMHRCKDYGVSFVRALVLRTPAGLRSKEKKRRTPWDRPTPQKTELVSKLEAIEKRYDFYSGLYRQYTTDLLKLCIHVRKLISNERVRAFLASKSPEVLQRFEGILFETQGDGVDVASQEAALGLEAGETAQA